MFPYCDPTLPLGAFNLTNLILGYQEASMEISTFLTLWFLYEKILRYFSYTNTYQNSSPFHGLILHWGPWFYQSCFYTMSQSCHGNLSFFWPIGSWGEAFRIIFLDKHWFTSHFKYISHGFWPDIVYIHQVVLSFPSPRLGDRKHTVSWV
jgi:hypothetical protein